MSDTPENTTQQPDYLSYLLRLWRMTGETVAWRGSVEHTQTGERLGFGNLDALFAFLREQTGLMSGTEGAQSPAEQRKGER